MLKPVELEIELFCRGMRIDAAAGRRITRTRAGLGSGLEIVIPAKPKDIWVNVPVIENFASHSVFQLREDDGCYSIVDGRNGAEYEVVIPSEPDWYSQK